MTITSAVRSLWAMPVLLILYPAGASNAIAQTLPSVSAGWYHNCVVREDALVACWGYNYWHQAPPVIAALSGGLKQVSAGLDYTCAVNTLGALFCWGTDHNGEAIPPAGSHVATDFAQVSANETHACSVKSDGTLVCWGFRDGRFPFLSVSGVKQVSAGRFHTCAVMLDGTISCWRSGVATDGQATPPPGGFSQVGAGWYHTCAVRTDGTIACWGYNRHGQAAGREDGPFRQVSASETHTCAVKMNGSLVCWGGNDVGQATPPVGSDEEGSFWQVSTGRYHSCAVRTNGKLACWGLNTVGQANPPDLPEITANPVAAVTTNRSAATLSLSDLNKTYNGGPQGVTVTSSPSGLSGVSVTYNGNATVPTSVGDYAVIASLINDDYRAPIAIGTLSIGKATQSIIFAQPPSPQAFGASFSITPTSSSALTVSVVASGGCSLLARTVTMTSRAASCTLTASQVGDGNWVAAGNVIRIVAVDSIPPTTVATPSPLANGAGWNNANVTVNLVAADNSGGSGIKQIQYSTTGAQPASGTVMGNTVLVAVAAEGSTKIDFFSSDNVGNAEMPTSLTIKIDKTPPAIVGMPAAGCALRPPNHKLVQVATITATDGLSGIKPGSLTVHGKSSEPSDPAHPDVVIAPNGSGGFVVLLQANRQGSGTGRIYTLNATATDLAGNSARATATCFVPHDQRR